MRYTTKVNYLGQEIELSTDSFRELHEAMAGIAELNADFRALYAYVRAEFGVENPRSITAAYRVDSDENEYYGVTCGRTHCDITYGQSRSKDRTIPFFPKGQENVFDPRKGRRQNGGDNGQAQRPSGAAPVQHAQPAQKRTQAPAEAPEFPGRTVTDRHDDGSYTLAPIDDDFPF